MVLVGGGRGIITGAEPSGGNASPPGVWWSGLCGGGPLLGSVGSVGSVATGCTAADMDRSTPPNSTGRQPPEPGPLLTAGRIPPPPGSGAYGKYSSSINQQAVSRQQHHRLTPPILFRFIISWPSVIVSIPSPRGSSSFRHPGLNSSSARASGILTCKVSTRLGRRSSLNKLQLVVTQLRRIHRNLFTVDLRKIHAAIVDHSHSPLPDTGRSGVVAGSSLTIERTIVPPQVVFIGPIGRSSKVPS
ncbi:unnamed protein product [Heterotrigona itama]|uniref:Uncharacterized protein n=1 Tax=Heterotrigona itama TaxID=395501 RepID=A0A6V7H7S4_9HYME|nr:unnamed protein product [Heterotrigona itama]